MATATFLASLVCLLCMVALGAASPIAMGNKDAAEIAVAGGDKVEEGSAPAGPAKEVLQGEGDDGVKTPPSSISAGTTENRLLKRSNRLVRARRGAAEDTSNEDAVPNFDQRNRDMISCVSQQANDTIPAAHIRGHGTKPFSPHTRESARFVKGYQQRWQCCEYTLTPAHNAHAFVDGGMIFNQTDKSLRVPVCGYYHISTQIYYKIDPATITNQSGSVYHLLKFERNCASWPDTNPVTVIGKSSVSNDDTTTYTSDVMRLCAGGKVWVEIPDLPNGVPCCPIGDEQGTFISAVLIAETSCHWPPDISMRNFN